jgi:hypothetical protein
MFDHFRPFFLIVFSASFRPFSSYRHLIQYLDTSPHLRSPHLHQISVSKLFTSLQINTYLLVQIRPIVCRIHPRRGPGHLQVLRDHGRSRPVFEHDCRVPWTIPMCVTSSRGQTQTRTNAPIDLRYPIVTTLLHLHASLLMPLFHHLWLNQGTANANFFYASTLVFACANGAALTDCIWAGLRIAIGEPQEGYVVVQE